MEIAQEEAQRALRKTTLPEFLDASHVHLHSSLAVQDDKNLSTQGDAANADSKYRPERILAWEDFPVQQIAIWNDLVESDFMLERHFRPLIYLEESGDAIRQRLMGSELDLKFFERLTVEDHISSILEQLYQNPTLRRKFCLKGSIQFENHSNTLSPEEQIERGMQEMSILRIPPPQPQRRSLRLLAMAKQTKLPHSVEPAESATTTAASARSARPRADQFCVYNITNKDQSVALRVPAFIIEYKAPHKLTLGRVYQGLENMELEEVVRRRPTDTQKDYSRRLVAAAITQAFSYMVQAGLEYGYVCTGQTFIFLRVPDDFRQCQFFLSVPQGDVGETTGRKPELDQNNRLHLTALGQVLAFTLQALRTPPRPQSWRDAAAAQLPTWEMVYDNVFDNIPKVDAPTSEYRPPPQSKHDFFRRSPIQLRRREASRSFVGCHSPEDQTQSSDDEFDPETPTRQSRQRTYQVTSTLNPAGKVPSTNHGSGHENSGRQYCTQRCLLGLMEGRGRLLDKHCPNVGDHGESHHQIDQPNFLILLRQQLSRDLDTDCDALRIHGSRGALFKVSLTSHGYTVAAKGTIVEFVADLRHEAATYERLRPIQGIHVPVHLGNLDLDRPYFYDGIARLVHMMFLSFGGRVIFGLMNADNQPYLAQRVQRSIQAIHELGVLHRDPFPRNILWNAEIDQAMIIDFERAKVLEGRPVLGAVSPNRKRKRIREADKKEQLKGDSEACEREMREAMSEFHSIA